MVKIEKGIPIPVRKPKYDYPFDMMEVGDSFEAENTYEKMMSRISYYRRKETHKLFKVIKTENNKVRVWRTR